MQQTWHPLYGKDNRVKVDGSIDMMSTALSYVMY